MAECSSCPLGNTVSALSEIIATHTVKIAPRSLRRPSSPLIAEAYSVLGISFKATSDVYVEMNHVEYKLFLECGKKKTPTRTALIKQLIAALPHFSRTVSLITDTLEPYQCVCLACSRSSDDNNLSSSGQCFVSLDAMSSAGVAAASSPSSLYSRPSFSDPLSSSLSPSDSNPSPSSSAPYLPDDPSLDPFFDDLSDDTDSAFRSQQTASDWLTRNARPVSSLPASQSISALPPDIESLLLTTLHTFAQLSIFDQLLFLSQMHGQTFTSFGTMKWLPKELKKRQSKQFVQQHWDRIKEKMPIAAVLRKKQPLKDLDSPLAKEYAPDELVQDELKLN